MSVLETLQVHIKDGMHKITALAVFFGLLIPASSHASGPPPVIIVQPLGLSVPSLGTATFTVVAVSGTTLNYKWYKNGQNLSGNNNGSILVLSGVTAADAGDYTVEVQNSGGKVTSSVATLTITSTGGITITGQPQNQSLSVGQTAGFSIASSGAVNRLFQWKKNGVSLSGATNALLTIPNVRASDAGSYTVTVSIPGTTVTSSAASLTVTNPIVNLAASGGGILGMTPSGFAFKMDLPVGVTYVVEATSDARNWTPIATNVAATANVVFTDAAAASYGSRFYRVTVR